MCVGDRWPAASPTTQLHCGLGSLGEGESRHQWTVSLRHTAIRVSCSGSLPPKLSRGGGSSHGPPDPTALLDSTFEATTGWAGLVHLLTEHRVLCLAPGADRRLRLTRALRPAPAQLMETQGALGPRDACSLARLPARAPPPGPAFPSEAPPPGEPTPGPGHPPHADGGQAQRPTVADRPFPKRQLGPPWPPHAPDFSGLTQLLPLAGGDRMKLLGEPG